MMIPLASLTAIAILSLGTSVSARRHKPGKEITFDCYPAGWVRAPDLYPGLSTPADARLYLNGTECDQVVKWEVGLRFKERAILKFAASNVTLPERPVWNDSLIMEEPEAEDQSGLAPILGDGFWRSSNREQDPYQKLMEEYEEKKKDKNLWVIRAVERDVFDTRMQLELHDGSENTTTVKDYHFYAVRHFNVHVPLTNYPPQITDSMTYYADFENNDLSHVENMFEYYFLLTKADGNELDVIVGQSGFLPAGPVPVKSDPLEREVTLTRPENEKPAGLPDHYDSGPWLPACDAGSDANFTVSLSIPDQGHLAPNTTYPIQIKIDKVGNSTEYPAFVRLRLGHCRNDTWAMGYARNDSQRTAADGCSAALENAGRFNQFDMGSGRSVVRMQRPFDQICGPDPDVVAEDEENEEDMFGMSGFWRMGGRDRSRGKKLDRDTWRLPVTADLVVHLNVTPSFQTTFFDLNNLLKVHLDTRFACEEEAPKSSSPTERDLTDNEAWQGEYQRRRPKTLGKRRTHIGNVLVDIQPLHRDLDTEKPVRPYTHPEAQGIVLSPSSTFEGSFPLANGTWQTEFEDKELTKHKWYPVWERQVRCEGDRFCEPGGAAGTVSDAWAKKGCSQWWAGKRDTAESDGMKESSLEGQQVFGA